MQAHTCTNGTATTFTCWYVNPATRPGPHGVGPAQRRSGPHHQALLLVLARAAPSTGTGCGPTPGTASTSGPASPPGSNSRTGLTWTQRLPAVRPHDRDGGPATPSRRGSPASRPTSRAPTPRSSATSAATASTTSSGTRRARPRTPSGRATPAGGFTARCRRSSTAPTRPSPATSTATAAATSSGTARAPPPTRVWFGRGRRRVRAGDGRRVRHLHPPRGRLRRRRARRHLLVRPGDGSRRAVVRARQAGFTTRTATVNGTYRSFTGDFDGDGRDDIFWYAPGTAKDSIWEGRASRTFEVQVDQRQRRLRARSPGDFNADRRTDVLWYGAGTQERRVLVRGGRRRVLGAPCDVHGHLLAVRRRLHRQPQRRHLLVRLRLHVRHDLAQLLTPAAPAVGLLRCRGRRARQRNA